MLLVIAISFLCCGTLAQVDDVSNSTVKGAKGTIIMPSSPLYYLTTTFCVFLALSVFQVVRYTLFSYMVSYKRVH